jgi:hypothetical protein
MPSEEDIKQQQELLYNYRRTLFTLLKQRAQITASFVPPAIATGIDEARDNIHRIKQNLRAMGVPIDDQQNDDEAPAPPLVSIGSVSFGSTNISKSSNIGWYIGVIGLLVAMAAVGFVLLSNRGNSPGVTSPTASNPVAQIPAPSSVPSLPPTATPTVEPKVEPTAEPRAEPTTAPTEIPVPTTAPPPPTAILPTATPQLPTSQHIEAEDGEVIKPATITNNETASHKLYVLMGGEKGEVIFTTYDLEAGQYKLVIHYDKYSNGAPIYPYEGYQYLYVNDSLDYSPIHYIKTHGDEQAVNFMDTSVIVVLKRGKNTLTIKNGPSDAVASIDYIELTLI